jgi:hypothetical protein
VALELKVLKPDETMHEVLAAALHPVRARSYSAKLRAAGAAPVIEMAAAFDRKQVRVAGNRS